MAKMKFENTLPDTVQDREKRRDAERDISRHLEEIRTHWAALLQIPEVAEKCKDIDVACEYENFITDIEKKIAEVQAMPLPITDKNQVICEWKEISRNIQYHAEKLIQAVDYFPCGYLTIEDGNPSTVDIIPKFRKELEDKGATVAVPQEAKELYQVFLNVVEAAREFEEYQASHNLNVRDFVSCVEHIRTAEDFAKNWINGTWKKY